MFGSFKRLLLGLGLILAASSVLLISDWGSRRATTKKAKPLPLVALLQYSSSLTMQEYSEGVIEGLAESGYVDGKTMRLVHFNAEGDLSTANMMAKQLTDGSYTLIITGTTICLQAVARANKVLPANTQTPHIFGGVIDPFIAGVGISRENPLNKPPYLTGMGTYQPVEDIFREAKRLCPTLKTVGVVWNPAEINSESCVVRARNICKELDITLLEASVEKATDVKEAAASLTGRGAEAIWTGGDATVGTAASALASVAKKERVVFFSNTYGYSRNPGGVFDYGASFQAIGHAVGVLSAKVLNGADTAQIPVENILPARVLLNYQGWNNLKAKDKWHFDDDIVSRANIIIDANGTERAVK